MQIPFVLAFILAWVLPKQLPDFATIMKQAALAVQRHRTLQYVLESTESTPERTAKQ